MLELLLIIIFLGLLISILTSKNIVNPFLIYFSIWFFVFLGYYIGQDYLIELSNNFLLAMVFVKITSFFLLLFSISIKIYSHEKYISISSRSWSINICQLVSLFCIPLIYLRAIQLTGGSDIFTISGFSALRLSVTEDTDAYGFYSYIMLMSWVIASIRFNEYIDSRRNGFITLIAIMNAAFNIYLSSGRTFALLLFILMLFPGIIIGKIRFKIILFSVILIILIFTLIATMTQKGLSTDIGFVDNLSSIFDNLLSYTIAPILAFSKLYDDIQIFDYGMNSFRTLFAILNALGLVEFNPVVLIKDFQFVPMPTNVYTVYEVYFRDAYLIGLFIPSVFLLFHFWLYKKATETRGKWLFFYSISAYPLLMQFFQDQYFSLLSTMIQLVFWIIIFIKHGRSKYKYG